MERSQLICFLFLSGLVLDLSGSKLEDIEDSHLVYKLGHVIGIMDNVLADLAFLNVLLIVFQLFRRGFLFFFTFLLFHCKLGIFFDIGIGN